MGDYLSILLIGGAFFAAVVVLLTAEPKISKRLTAIAGGVAFVGGLLVYGYGYIAVSETFLQAVLHTVFAVCRIFIGEADFGDISEAPLFRQQWAVTVCWAVHVLAFYATSSTVISLVGANALKNLRARLAVKKDLNIIFGVNEDSAEFGQALQGDARELVVYVAEDTDSPLADTILESGAILRADPKAIRGDQRFLASLGVRKGDRKITVYALHEDYLENVEYAAAILSAFEKKGVAPQQISLVIHAREDNAVKRLQVVEDRFGYGFVTVFEDHDLTARLLVQKYPPCHCISFDSVGTATEDFEAVVVGFGQIGQAVLRKIIMNSQFVGSTFRADVFAPDLQERNGFFINSYPGILENYQVVFHAHDGRSTQMYRHLNERFDKIKYIAVCTGSETLNDEIENELRTFFSRRGKNISIHQCSYRGIRTTDAATMETVTHKVYHPDVLSTKRLDEMAMVINQYYCGQYSKGALADWMACDYFSRMSSRASADFIEAMLRAAGKTEQQVLSGAWEFTPVHLETLSKMEHERWNAFHFCMGFLPMGEEEYTARANTYLEQRERTGKGSIRIGKNMENRTHACLVSWDALDELSRRENDITGGSVNYKQMDTNNVLLIPELLRIRSEKQ